MVPFRLNWPNTVVSEFWLLERDLGTLIATECAVCLYTPDGWCQN
jgi:hypothetical protein